MGRATQRRWHAVAGVVAAGVVAAGVLALAACGSGEPDASGGPDLQAPPQESAPPETSGSQPPVQEPPAEELTVPSATPEGRCAEVTALTLQLPDLTRAQFAGYYAARDRGFYQAQCLDVSILEGGGDIVPQAALAQGDADFAIAWVPGALASREQGAGIVNVAQVFQRSGTVQVAWADSGITTPGDFLDRRIGTWRRGGEFEVITAVTEAGLDPASDFELVQQQFDMTALLNREIDAAEAMTYNEYAQLLGTRNPETGELYTAEDFTVISYQEAGVGMLQDAIWASEERLRDAAFQDITQRFVTASLEGWIHCRDKPEDCASIVRANGSRLGASHQLWMMNEVNRLIWPSPAGVGVMNPDAWGQTVAISLGTKNLEGSTVITAEPAEGAWTDQYAVAANEQLTAAGMNTTGEAFAPISVTLNEGGN